MIGVCMNFITRNNNYIRAFQSAIFFISLFACAMNFVNADDMAFCGDNDYQSSCKQFEEKQDLKAAMDYFDAVNRGDKDVDIVNDVNDFTFDAEFLDQSISYYLPIPFLNIIDVRAAKDFNQEHIVAAINLPYDDFNNFEITAEKLSQNQREQIVKNLRESDINYVYAYHRTCKLATKAAKLFASMGYDVQIVRGGWKQWKENNLLIEKGILIEEKHGV